MSQRQLTLDEWVERLPEGHRARKELTALRASLAKAEDQLDQLADMLPVDLNDLFEEEE